MVRVLLSVMAKIFLVAAVAKTTEEHAECICPPDTYSQALSDVISAGADTIHCLACPDGADCRFAGTHWETLENLAGWWRPSNDSQQFYRCLLPAMCVEGRSQACAENREGPLCAL